MGVLTFPVEAVGDFCLSCGQTMKTHGAQCRQDVTVGQDQLAIARRLRLARLQLRSVRLRPWAVDVAEDRQ